MINLRGSFSAKKSLYLQLKVNYCTKDYLNKKYPNQNKTCKPIDEINRVIDDFVVDVPVMMQYFDEAEFELNPLKSKLEYFYFYLNSNIKNTY